MKYIYFLIQVIALSVWIPAVAVKTTTIFSYPTQWVDLSPFVIKCVLSGGVFLLANSLMWRAILSERVGHE